VNLKTQAEVEKHRPKAKSKKYIYLIQYIPYTSISHKHNHLKNIDPTILYLL